MSQIVIHRPEGGQWTLTIDGVVEACFHLREDAVRAALTRRNG